MSEDFRKDVAPGMVVRVHQKIVDINTKGEEKERIQVFEGIVLARKHGATPGATITVRKVSNGVGVEKIFPVYSTIVDKIEILKKMKVRQSRPYYIRSHKKKLKEIREPRVKKAEKTAAAKAPASQEEKPEVKEVKKEEKPKVEKKTEEKK